MKISAGGGFGKTSQGDERRREKKKRHRVEKKGYLGKYSSREKCKRRESERKMGLVVDQDQGLTSYAPSTCRSRSKSGSNNPSKNKLYPLLPAYLSISAHDNPLGAGLSTAYTSISNLPGPLFAFSAVSRLSTVTLKLREKNCMCHVRPRGCRVRFERPCSSPADRVLIF